MKIPLPQQIEKLQPKIHGIALGMTLGIGNMMISQGCPLSRQCQACASQLRLLALPLLADGVLVLTTQLAKKGAKVSASS